MNAPLNLVKRSPKIRIYDTKKSKKPKKKRQSKKEMIIKEICFGSDNKSWKIRGSGE